MGPTWVEPHLGMESVFVKGKLRVPKERMPCIILSLWVYRGFSCIEDSGKRDSKETSFWILMQEWRIQNLLPYALTAQALFPRKWLVSLSVPRLPFSVFDFSNWFLPCCFALPFSFVSIMFSLFSCNWLQETSSWTVKPFIRDSFSMVFLFCLLPPILLLGLNYAILWIYWIDSEMGFRNQSRLCCFCAKVGVFLLNFIGFFRLNLFGNRRDRGGKLGFEISWFLMKRWTVVG